MLLSEHGNDFKVKWVSGVHDNIFRQTTVVNHLQAPARTLVIQVSSWRAELQMAEDMEEKSGVTGMKIELLFLLCVDPGEVKSDCWYTLRVPRGKLCLICTIHETARPEYSL